MDRRQKKSRKAIFMAFNKLLEEKSYSRITVQEIIDEADVGRTTFYSHFPTKDALLRVLSDEIFNHVLTTALEKEATHDYSQRNRGFEELISHILYHIRDNTINMRRILCSEGRVIFLNCFKERFVEYLSMSMVIDIEGIPMSYVINLISSGLISTIEWWLENSMQPSPERVSFYFSHMFLLENISFGK